MSTQGHLLTFNRLLAEDGFDLTKLLVFRHRPTEPALNRVFDWIAAERRDLFCCYQDTHGPRAESALSRAKYLASFIRYKPRKSLFVGLYAIDGQQRLTIEQYQARPLYRELVSLGMRGYNSSDGRDGVIEFALRETDWHREWSEKLVIDWPGLERSWYRWADRNEFKISAIYEESCLRTPIPPWYELVLSWGQLAYVPEGWRLALSQWRGIYLIIDQCDGKQYVGSAYGQSNLWQRWLEYSRTGHGGNKLLRIREPKNFWFSILQRTSPDMPDADVIALEGTWKRRLRTQAPYGLNEN